MISQEITRNPDTIIIQKEVIEKEVPTTTINGISMSADAVNGSDVITITGNTSFRGTDVTLIVNSPVGNLITIAQITPEINGDFKVEIKV